MTEVVPKAMLPVLGVPFVDHQLELFARNGIRRVLFSVGHLGEQLRAHVGDGSRWGVAASYVDEGPSLRGTGGALRLALEEGALDDTFLVTYGDSYLPIPHRPVWEALDEGGGGDVVMTVLRNEGRFDRSNVRFEDGVLRYEKGVAEGMTHIDFGLLALRRSVVDEIPADTVVDLSEVLRDLSTHGRILGREVTSRFYEIGSPEGLRALEEHLARGDVRPRA